MGEEVGRGEKKFLFSHARPPSERPRSGKFFALETFGFEPCPLKILWFEKEFLFALEKENKNLRSEWITAVAKKVIYGKQNRRTMFSDFLVALKLFV